MPMGKVVNDVKKFKKSIIYIYNIQYTHGFVRSML